MQIYVGNISYNTTEEGLNDLFSGFGNVENVKIIIDRETNRSKGFGFITMSDKSEAQKAIEELNDKEFEGRNLKVNEAKPREPRPRNNYNRY